MLQKRSETSPCIVGIFSYEHWITVIDLMINTNIDVRNHPQFPLLCSSVAIIGLGIMTNYQKSSSVLSTAAGLYFRDKNMKGHSVIGFALGS